MNVRSTVATQKQILGDDMEETINYRTKSQEQERTPTQKNVSVYIVGGMVHMQFPYEVRGVDLTGNQAIDIGNALLKYGRRVNKNG